MRSEYSSMQGRFDRAKLLTHNSNRPKRNAASIPSICNYIINLEMKIHPLPIHKREEAQNLRPWKSPTAQAGQRQPSSESGLKGKRRKFCTAESTPTQKRILFPHQVLLNGNALQNVPDDSSHAHVRGTTKFPMSGGGMKKDAPNKDRKRTNGSSYVFDTNDQRDKVGGSIKIISIPVNKSSKDEYYGKYSESPKLNLSLTSNVRHLKGTSLNSPEIKSTGTTLRQRSEDDSERLSKETKYRPETVLKLLPPFTKNKIFLHPRKSRKLGPKRSKNDYIELGQVKGRDCARVSPNSLSICEGGVCEQEDWQKCQFKIKVLNPFMW